MRYELSYNFQTRYSGLNFCEFINLGGDQYGKYRTNFN